MNYALFIISTLIPIVGWSNGWMAGWLDGCCWGFLDQPCEQSLYKYAQFVYTYTVTRILWGHHKSLHSFGTMDQPSTFVDFVALVLLPLFLADPLPADISIARILRCGFCRMNCSLLI